MVATIPIRFVRNSELYKLVEQGLIKPGSSKKAILPSGNNITLEYVKNDGVAKALEESAKYGMKIEPKPENYIRKTIVSSEGHKIVSRHDVVDGGTRLNSIAEECPNGTIEHVYLNDGKNGGHIWSNGMWDSGICWGFDGNVTHPKSVSTSIHIPPFKNEESVDAFKAATDYIRGRGSLENYKAQMVK